MAIATRTLKDTKIATGSGAAGGKVTVLVNMNDNTTADSNILDASGLAGHANGAMLDITRIWWALVQGTADDNTGWVQIQFKGASSDTVAINLAGTGHYDGTAGKIENNATNTTATSGDLELSAYGVSGYVLIELRKDESFTA
jgi:hypothetical protein|tara:strand:- start:246 stop:674 length:429 start_codon:yes stop_codon:yes gene_type:complete